MSRQAIDETDNKYGMLTVIKRTERPKGVGTKCGSAFWKCLCDCGRIAVVRGGNLRFGYTRSCGCLHKLSKGVAAFNTVYKDYQIRATRRGYDWAITKEECKNIIQQNCHYCGVPPSNTTARRTTNGQYTYNGLDRKDNNKGYTIDNVVPCCSTCNYAKKSMSVVEYKAFIFRAYNHLKGGDIM